MTNYQLLPPLSGADYESLKADIAARGVMVPIEYDQDGNVLDGHHRLRICSELGIGEWVRLSDALANVRVTRGQAPRREHSRKPDEAYEIIKRMFPELPKIELFARHARQGWAIWGNEAPSPGPLDMIHEG